ncbi:single-stranded DNA-binding protein [Flagellimonas sp. C4]|uniref:single-stranded DNA-binding protein n=1 Tax=Flagellimonas alginolytica TaxID=3177515 RepID=UPI0035C92695
MSNLKNKVQLIGNVGGNPENIQFENENTKLVKFSLATNETYKNAQGEKVTDTEWHNIIAWGKTAQFVEKHLTKGKHIALEGKLKTRSYETESGEKRYITEVVARDIVFLSAREDGSEEPSNEEE